MKLAKKLISLTLAIMMVAVLGVAVLAAGTGKITIENASGGKIYKIYKIFDATYDPTSTTAASYYMDSNDTVWLPKIRQATITDGSNTQNVFTISETSNPNVVLVKANVADDVLLQWFQSDDIKNFVDGLHATATKVADSYTVEFDGLDFGYYYVTSSLGSTVTITNVQNEKTVYDKNVTPSWGADDDGTEGGKYIAKADGSSVTLVKNDSTEFGTVNYKIIAYNAPNYDKDQPIKDYVIDDYAGDAIYADMHSVKVYVNGTEINGGWIKGVDGDSNSNHAVNGNDGVSEGDCNWYITNAVDDDGKFSITIKWKNADGSFRYTKTDGTPNKIEITYSATLRSNATIGKNADSSTSNNKNSATLKWTRANGSNGTTNESTVYSSIYALTLIKKETGSDKKLAGAVFQLKDSNNNVIELYRSTSTNEADGIHVYYVKNNYTQNVNINPSEKKWTTDNTYSTFTTPSDGTVVVVGLAAGDYTLSELIAPDGYNLMDSAHGFDINDGKSDYTVSKNGASLESVKVEIANSTGTTLPETGGTGTIIFIVVGAVAVIGAGLFLVTNKRMSKEGI